MSNIPSKGTGRPSVHMVLCCESEHDLYSRMSNLSSRKKNLKKLDLVPYRGCRPTYWSTYQWADR